jgi:hypothetical protein
MIDAEKTSEGTHRREPLQGGWEYDALTSWGKRWYGWAPGTRREIRQAHNRRLRRAVKVALDKYID